MVYQVERMLRDVYVSIDEAVSTPQCDIGRETLTALGIDEIAESKLAEAVRRVVLSAPSRLLMPCGGELFGDSVSWSSDGCSGWVMLPDDYLRLVVFRMSDWERAVHDAVDVDSVEYALQRGRLRGLRGTPQRPVVAVVPRQEGAVLEFYSCRDTTATVEQALCMLEPRVDRCGGIEIPEKLYKSAVYLAGSLVLVTMGEDQAGAALADLSKSLII